MDVLGGTNGERGGGLHRVWAAAGRHGSAVVLVFRLRLKPTFAFHYNHILFRLLCHSNRTIIIVPRYLFSISNEGTQWILCLF